MTRFLIAAAALALAPIANATEIDVAYSESFQEKLEEDYGVREGDRLSTELRQDLERELERRDADPAKIVVTIVDAKPNKPTFKQLGDRPSLDFQRSISLGGMEVTAQAFDAEGNVVSEFDYKFFENNLDRFSPGVGFSSLDLANTAVSTWFDARRASDRFARRFAKELAG